MFLYGRCHEIQVRSTGSDVVDSVRMALSYSEVIASLDKAFFNSQSMEDQTKFKDKVFNLLMDKKWFGITKIDTNDYGLCISMPPKLKPNGMYVTTKVMDSSFFVNITMRDETTKECLRLANVKGFIDCKFYVRNGLEQDAQVVTDSVRVLKTFGTNKTLPWQIQRGLALTANTKTTTSHAKVIYTLWVRLMMKLLSRRETSTVFVKPQPLPFFQHNKAEFLDQFKV